MEGEEIRARSLELEVGLGFLFSFIKNIYKKPNFYMVKNELVKIYWYDHK